MKISGNLNVELMENFPQIYLIYQFLLSLLPYLLWENMKIFDFFFKLMERIKLCVHRSYDKMFANSLKVCKFTSIRSQAKNDILKDA